MRAFTDAFWSLDPDVVLLRGDDIDDARRVDRRRLLRDGRRQLSARRRSAGERRCGARWRSRPRCSRSARDGVAARPADLASETDVEVFQTPFFVGNNDTAVPHVWTKKTKDGAHGWLAVFGWGIDAYVTHVDVPTGAYGIVVPAAAGPLVHQPFSGGDVAVPVHAARLFAW